jgi:hypothetical protein
VKFIVSFQPKNILSGSDRLLERTLAHYRAVLRNKLNGSVCHPLQTYRAISSDFAHAAQWPAQPL